MTDPLNPEPERPNHPYAFIQWKGTNVCADVMCACGAQGHIDSISFYYYRCHACGAVSAVGCCVRLYPLTPEQTATVEARVSPEVILMDEETAALDRIMAELAGKGPA